MTNEQLQTIASQLEAAAEIIRGTAPAATKINTLERIGGICTFHGKRWGDEEFNRVVAEMQHHPV